MLELLFTIYRYSWAHWGPPNSSTCLNVSGMLWRKLAWPSLYFEMTSILASLPCLQYSYFSNHSIGWLRSAWTLWVYQCATAATIVIPLQRVL